MYGYSRLCDRLRSSAIIWKQAEFSLRLSVIVCDHMETSLNIGTVNMEGQVIEIIDTKTIDYVAFFYREGAKGDDFLHVLKTFRCCFDSSSWKSVVRLHEHVRFTDSYVLYYEISVVFGLDFFNNYKAVVMVEIKLKILLHYFTNSYLTFQGPGRQVRINNRLIS